MLCKSSLIRLTLGFFVASILSFLFVSHPPTAFGQNAALVKPTTGGSLKVKIEPTPITLKVDTPTKFKITFSKSAGNVQPHIDYDFLITNNGKGIFSASSSTGQTGVPLHTAEGIVTIPYVFHSSGNYLLTVKVFGILFNPIRPESADFPIKVT